MELNNSAFQNIIKKLNDKEIDLSNHYITKIMNSKFMNELINGEILNKFQLIERQLSEYENSYCKSNPVKVEVNNTNMV